MVFEGRASGWGRAASWVTSSLGMAGLLAACATGLEPDRSGLAGGGGEGAGLEGGGGTATTSPTTGSGGTTTSATTTSATTTSTTSSTTTTSTTSSTTTTTDTGPPPDGVYVQYKTTISTPSTNQIKAVFNVVNGSPDPVALDALTIRYHYTIDGDMAQEFHCDYALLGCAVVSGSFSASAGVNADHYVEVALSAAAGTLAPGAQTGEIQARWNKVGFTNFDQSNDYSFDGALVDFTTWDKVTVHYNGALVWGVEP